EVVAAALLADHGLVDLAGGDRVPARQADVDEALVVAEVEVGFGAVVGDIHLAVLERAHRARIDVDVGVQLHHRHLEAAGLEDRGERGGRDALAERGHHAAGDENERSDGTGGSHGECAPAGKPHSTGTRPRLARPRRRPRPSRPSRRGRSGLRPGAPRPAGLDSTGPVTPGEHVANHPQRLPPAREPGRRGLRTGVRHHPSRDPRRLRASLDHPAAGPHPARLAGPAPRTPQPMNSRYNAADIEVLSGLDPVKRRPGMYTDTTRPNHLAQEVIDNAVDEALAGHAREIAVTMFRDGSCEVSDDGRGMPVDIHPEEKIPGVELILTRLHAGGKFSNRNYTFSGGLHGVGVSVVNALSTLVEVHIKRDGSEHRVSFRNGDRATPLEVVGTVGRKNTGTRVRFWPDPKYFDSPKFSLRALRHLLRAKAVLCPGLTVTLLDEASGERD